MPGEEEQFESYKGAAEAFPSGAVYPINAFPPWMKVITVVDPFTYVDLTVRQLEALPRPHDRLDVLSRDLRSAHDRERTQSDDAAGDLPHR